MTFKKVVRELESAVKDLGSLVKGHHARHSPERRLFREIKPSDVGSTFFYAFGKNWRVETFIGNIQPRDVGKRVVLVAPDMVQVENDVQRAKRSRASPERQIGDIHGKPGEGDFVLVYHNGNKGFVVSQPYRLEEMAIEQACALSRPGSYGGEVRVGRLVNGRMVTWGVAKNGSFKKSFSHSWKDQPRLHAKAAKLGHKHSRRSPKHHGPATLQKAVRDAFVRALRAGKSRTDAVNHVLDEVGGKFSRDMSEEAMKLRRTVADIAYKLMRTVRTPPKGGVHSDHAKWAAETKRPGKFQGEAAYVPYFYDQTGEGEFAKNGDEIFRVDAEDRDIFPELKGRKTVRLHYRDDGFVVEV